ncbi:MAG: hypothetical protein HKO66_06535 [Saprospiraceae bacterium]|nr:gliding motility-associated C-terminal domain-containing protein [Bacteroidia bacterium]NNL91869.1 hypothetical protein [Saprospiraceae bacterium]
MHIKVSNAQLCTECDLDCIICTDIDGFEGNNGSDEMGSGPPSFCTINQHQMTWLGFIASSEDFSVDVVVGGCASGNLEVGLFEAIDCNGSTLISNCYGGSTGTALSSGETGTITANQDLVIGQYYFLVFDMTSGPPANCDFTLNVVSGETGAPDLIDPPVLEGPDAICDGESFTFIPDPIAGATSYEWELDGEDEGESEDFIFDQTEQGTYTICATPLNYCTTGLQSCTEISVGSSYDTTYYEQICQGDCILFEGEMFCDEEYEEFEYESFYGCDSIINLELTLYNPENEIDLGAFFICQGEELEVDDIDYYDDNDLSVEDETFEDPGIHFVDAFDENGCLYYTEFELNVLDIDTAQYEISICENEFYVFGNDTLEIGGEYCAINQSSNNCDSLTIINLIISSNFDTIIEQTICNQDSILFRDTTLTESGSYIFNLKSPFGCDSIFQLNLTNSDTIIIDRVESICSGEVLIFGDTTLTTEGRYENIISSPGECDSLEVLQLSIRENSDYYLSISICEGDSFSIASQTVFDSNLYEFHILNSEQCDSTIILELEVTSDIVEEYNFAVCTGEMITLGGIEYTEEDTYVLESQSFDGCDSTTILNLTVLETFSNNEHFSICENDSIFYEGIFYASNGNYEVPLLSQNNCDSIIMLSIAVNNHTESIISEERCEGDIYTFYNTNIDSSGLYSNVLTNHLNCDSTVYLDITFHANPITQIDLVQCIGDTVFFYGLELIQSGLYSGTDASSMGCDSTILLNLSFEEIVSSNMEIYLCIGETFDFFGEEITEAGQYSEHLPSSSGCDSIVYLDAFFEDCNLYYSVEITDNQCFGDAKGIIEINIENGAFPLNVEWYQDLGSSEFLTLNEGDDNLILSGLSSTTYNIQITDRLGNSTNLNFDIQEPAILQADEVLSNYNLFNIQCFGDNSGSINIIPSGGTAPYSEVIWNDGVISNIREELFSGTFNYSFQDVNGCMFEGDIELVEPDSLSLIVDLDFFDPCDFSQFNFDTYAEGGFGNINVSIYQEPNHVIINEPTLPGNYSVVITDENGCNKTEYFMIPNNPDLIIDLGIDLTINEGEFIFLEPTSSLNIVEYSWFGDGHFELCQDCSNQDIQIFDDASISVVVIFENGCESQDEISINVIHPVKFFVPNSLSPLHNTNQYFNIFHSEDIDLSEFKIYSRWGQLVFDDTSILTNNIESGWDGTVNGDYAEQGVYVYYILLEDMKGDSHVLTGNITLLK